MTDNDNKQASGRTGKEGKKEEKEKYLKKITPAHQPWEKSEQYTQRHRCLYYSYVSKVRDAISSSTGGGE